MNEQSYKLKRDKHVSLLTKQFSFFRDEALNLTQICKVKTNQAKKAKIEKQIAEDEKENVEFSLRQAKKEVHILKKQLKKE